MMMGGVLRLDLLDKKIAYIQFIFAFEESPLIRAINQVHDTVYFWKIVPP